MEFALAFCETASKQVLVTEARCAELQNQLAVTLELNIQANETIKAHELTITEHELTIQALKKQLEELTVEKKPEEPVVPLTVSQQNELATWLMAAVKVKNAYAFRGLVCMKLKKGVTQGSLGFNEHNKDAMKFDFVRTTERVQVELYKLLTLEDKTDEELWQLVKATFENSRDKNYYVKGEVNILDSVASA